MYKIACSIEGIAPLLQNRHPFPEELEKVNRDKREDYDYEIAKYQLEDGRLYQPAEHLVASMTKAAVYFQIEGKGKKTYKDSVKASIFIDPEKILHKNQAYEKYRAFVTINRASVVKSRPMLNNWSLDFTIIVVDNQFPASVVENILKYAGAGVGIGDYRPRFGRFKVTDFQVQKNGDVNG